MGAFNNKGILFALGAAIVSGVSIYLNKFVVGQTDPVLFSFLKNLLVAIVLGAFLVKFSDVKKAFSKKTALPLGYVSLFSGGLAFLLFFLGLKETTAVSANFFHKSMFLGVLALSIFLLKKNLSFRNLAVSGAILAGNFLFWKVAKISLNYGDFLILGATLLWAGEATIVEKFLSKVPARTLSLVRFAGGLPVLLSFLLFGKRTDWSIAFNSFQWTLGLAGVLLLYALLYFSAVKTSGAFATTAVLSASPLVTYALSSGLSFPTLSQGFGAAIIVGALSYFLLSERRAVASS